MRSFWSIHLKCDTWHDDVDVDVDVDVDGDDMCWGSDGMRSGRLLPGGPRGTLMSPIDIVESIDDDDDDVLVADDDIVVMLYFLFESCLPYPYTLLADALLLLLHWFFIRNDDDDDDDDDEKPLRPLFSASVTVLVDVPVLVLVFFAILLNKQIAIILSGGEPSD